MDRYLFISFAGLATRLQQSLPRRDLPYPMPVPDNPLCIPPPLFPNPRYGSSFPGILGGPRDLFPDMEGIKEILS